MQRLNLRAAPLAVALLIVLEACSPAGTASPTPPPVTASPTPVSSATVQPASSGPTEPATPTATAALTSGGLTGTWNGTWQDVTPDQVGGTFTLTWTQEGNALSGTIVVAGTRCLSAATVTGTVSGSAITFGAVSGANTVVYTGTIGGSSMSGNYTAPGGCGDAQGTWTATRT